MFHTPPHKQTDQSKAPAQVPTVPAKDYKPAHGGYPGTPRNG